MKDIRLVYLGWLPKISNKQVHRLAVYNLMKKGRKVFGTNDIPPSLHPQVLATVRVVRVLGPRQKIMDRDKIALTTAGLVDALVPGYIKDDSETWADISYTNDRHRRHDGPAIEIFISYTSEMEPLSIGASHEDIAANEQHGFARGREGRSQGANSC